MLKPVTPPLFELIFGSFTLIIKKWSVGLILLCNGEYKVKSFGRVKDA